jgi:hypothetical protein
MGGMYAMTSLVKLVALFGKDGITKEEIQRLNKESFSAKLDWDYQFANALDMASFNEYVQFREGKYYPNLEKTDLDNAEKSYKKIMKERMKWKRKKSDR